KVCANADPLDTAIAVVIAKASTVVFVFPLFNVMFLYACFIGCREASANFAYSSNNDFINFSLT
ncbi:MAG: hypothetical protein P8I79_07390, partial [Amylibacter sp.]|nr:hypothetical protein [Amylibacter sp.]